jgi:predicted dehydrogenase
MKDLGIGIVGLGWVAGAHIETFKHVTGARVTAISSRSEHEPADLERRYGIPLRPYTDYAEMLADPEVDVVDICTPHPQHAEQAIRAAKAGKHLIIEKPIALSWQDAKAMRAAIRRAGVQAMVCFEVRFSAQFQLARSIVEQGLLGELHYAEVDYYHGIGPWYGQFGWNVKKDWGGSSLLTAGCHALDALLMLMKAPVEEVTSYSTGSRNPIFAPYEYDTTSVTILKFKGGKLGKVASVTDCLQPYYFHTHLVGSEGSLLDNRIHSQRLQGMVKSEWSTLATHLVDSGDVKDHPYQPQFQAFVDATRAGKPMPLTDFDTALESHRVVFAADLSASRGRPVRMSELK